MNNSTRRAFYKTNDGSFVNNKTVIKIILVLLILFFGLQFLSHIFLEIGKGKTGSENIGFLKWSSKLSPIEAKPLLEYGFALLKKSELHTGKQLLEKSIYYLNKSIGSNMLYYNGHLYLGKAYLARNLGDHTSFDLAVSAFKRASLIRGNIVRVSMDTMTILLSLWPLLDEKDRNFCTDLLKKTIGKLGREDFNSLLDTWALYSRDINFFKDVLNKKPQYYLLVAQKLRQLETGMETRREFLSKHTAYSIAGLKDLYQKYRSERPNDLLRKLKSIFNSLDRRMSIYYLKDRGRKSKQKGYFEFKKRVNLDILELLFSKNGWQKDSRLRAELENSIVSYIKDLSAMNELKSFNDFLAKKEYLSHLLIEKEYLNLRLSDLKAFYIQQLIAFKSGQYDSVITDTEKFRRENPFDKKAPPKIYNDILLLLTDAYISSRLLTRANSTLKEVRKSEVKLADYYWRKKIIERVIGPDENESNEQQYAVINNSRFIELRSPSLKRTIYLVNNKEVEIRFADDLYEKIKSAHLLQVFIDGNLVYEEYISRLVSPVKVPIPAEKNYSKHTLAVKIM